MRKQVDLFFQRLIHHGIAPQTNAENKRLLLFHRFAVLAFLWVAPGLALVAVLAHATFLALLLATMSVMYLLVFGLTYNGQHLASKILYNYGIILVVGVSYYWVGGTNNIYLWFFGTMVYAAAVFSNDENLAKYVSFSLSFVGFVGALVNNTLRGGFTPKMHVENVQWWLLSSDVVALTVTGLIIVFLAESTRVMETKLEHEFERSEGLLLNILPRPAARRLKHSSTLIADGYDEVSVLFCDLVGFTQLSEKLSPQELVALLNKLFSEFDDLTQKHGLEKIKTIGDAYMVVGGLPEPSDTHMFRLAEMALDMRAVVETFRSQDRNDFKVRIGMHVGPVVAGVIGQLKFAYDLWGSTVNIASRMESSAAEASIQVSRRVYDILQHDYDFEARGEILIKGKGMMETFFLLGHKQHEEIFTTDTKQEAGSPRALDQKNHQTHARKRM